MVNNGVRIFELAPCPSTSKCDAFSGRIRIADTSPFDEVAMNFNGSSFSVIKLRKLMRSGHHRTLHVFDAIRIASSKPMREPVRDHFHDVRTHHYRRRQLRIVGREAVGIVHEEMVEVG